MTVSSFSSFLLIRQLNMFCDFILKFLIKRQHVSWSLGQLIFGGLNYLCRSLWGSLLESPWTDLIWISSPNRSCRTWRDIPVHTCTGDTNVYLHFDQQHLNRWHIRVWLLDIFTSKSWCVCVSYLPLCEKQFLRFHGSKTFLTVLLHRQKNQMDESTRLRTKYRSMPAGA